MFYFNTLMHFLCILAIFKNEDVIFKEWLDHYIAEGVDHFFLIDNGSTRPYTHILEPYMNKITLVVDPSHGQQVALYNRMMDYRDKQMEWLLVCDLDEFVYGTKGTLADFMRTIVDPTVGAIQIPWLMFGSSDHIEQPSSVVQSFRWRKRDRHPLFKSIVRPKALQYFHVHQHPLREGYTSLEVDARSEDAIAAAPLRLNHYAIQSLNWFREVKLARGDAMGNDSARDETYFKNYDHKDVYDDSLALKRMPEAAKSDEEQLFDSAIGLFWALLPLVPLAAFGLYRMVRRT